MHPILFRIGHFPIHVYSLTFATSIMMCVVLGLRRARVEKIDEQRFLQALSIAIVAIFFTSKALDILVNWRWYGGRTLRLLNLGYGHVFYGGYLGSVIFPAIFLRWKKEPILPVIDICATYMPLGLALHRAIGCFCAGCCYGVPTTLPWGVVFPPGSPAFAQFGGVPVHPTEIYEAMLGLAMFPALLAWRRLPHRQPGELFALQNVLYGAGRFAIEFVRGDADRGQYGGLSTSQWVSLGMFAVAGALAAHAWRGRKMARAAVPYSAR